MHDESYVERIWFFLIVPCITISSKKKVEPPNTEPNGLGRCASICLSWDQLEICFHHRLSWLHYGYIFFRWCIMGVTLIDSTRPIRSCVRPLTAARRFWERRMTEPWVVNERLLAPSATSHAGRGMWMGLGMERCCLAAWMRPANAPRDEYFTRHILP